MSKQYDIQYFRAVVNGEEIHFRCHTTDTRNGFCHTVETYSYDNDAYNTGCTKASYCNRTWERFRYESALERAIEKLPKAVRQSVYDQVIDGKAAEEERRCEEQLAKFKALHDGLSEENKERLANSGIEINSEERAQGVMGLMALMSLMQ